MDAKTIRALKLDFAGAASESNLSAKMKAARLSTAEMHVVATLEVAAQLADLNKTLEGVTGPKFSGDPRGYVLTKEVGS